MCARDDSAKVAPRHLNLSPSRSCAPVFQTGESVEARYTADDKWYKAVVLQVIHGGFNIAR